MRQVSWIGTALLMLSAFALWVPFPAASGQLATETAASFPIEPLLFAVQIAADLLNANPALKVIASLLLLWAGIGLVGKTATLAK